MTTIPDAVPPYPSTLSALKPHIQTSSSLFKYHPSSTFLALTVSRRAKQWKLHYVVLTSPPPATSPTHDFADLAQRPCPEMRPEMLQISTGEFTPLPSTRHSHLHLFKSASPSPEELEIDRLEINEDSVVYVAEVEVAGKRDIVKVGGRDARRNLVGSGGASFKSTGSSWHGGTKTDNEANMEEMGRTMWWLKMTDGPEMQQWMGHIRTAVFMQRAERAGMFQQHAPSTVPSMKADLDVLLSLRSQGLLPSIAASSGTATPPYPGYTESSMDTISQASRLSTQKPPSSYNHMSITNATSPTPSPAPNPRYAEHVGGAPSYTSRSSIRARTYPPQSALSHGLPSLKSLFSPSSSPSSAGFGHVNGISSSKGATSSRQGSRPSSPQLDNEKDIDPISDDVVSFGNRATALLNLFRSTSRASNSHNQYTGMGSSNSTTTTPPAATTRSHGIGTPISPVGHADETLRGKPSGAGVHPTAYSVDWSSLNGESTAGSLNKHGASSGAPSLPPPPRHPRRPIANGSTRGKTVDIKSHQLKHRFNGTGHVDREGSVPERRLSSSHGRHTPSPSILSPPTSPPSIPGSSFRGGRPPSANSMSSYASAEGDRSSEVERGNSMP
ncbi:hypothetical protein JB92DRAFT_1183694 [Gautieria morchelliformis]|nr:hypothetical protein JB92DRAFT_1183694 [Gautieria morchelliformis]